MATSSWGSTRGVQTFCLRLKRGGKKETARTCSWRKSCGGRKGKSAGGKKLLMGGDEGGKKGGGMKTGGG